MSAEIEHHESCMLHNLPAHRRLLEQLELILTTPRLRARMRPNETAYVSKFLDLPRIQSIIDQIAPTKVKEQGA